MTSHNYILSTILLLFLAISAAAQPSKNTLLVGTVQPLNEDYGIDLQSQSGFTSMYVEGLGMVTFYNQPYLESGNFPENGFFLYESLSQGNSIYLPLGKDGIGVTGYDDISAGDTYSTITGVPGGVNSLGINRNMLYAAGNTGLNIYDISNGGSPEYKGGIETGGNNVYTAVSMNFVFLAALQAGVTVIDVTDPENPLVAGAFDTPGQASGLAVDYPNLYIADGSEGIIIVDMGDPENMEVLGRYDTPGYASGIDAENNFLYVADGNKGLRIIDMTDINNPVETGWYETPFRAASVDIFNDLAFVGDGSGKMIIIKNLLY